MISPRHLENHCHVNAVKHRCWSTPNWHSTLFSTTSLKAKIDEALKARYLTICCLTFQQQWCSKFSNPISYRGRSHHPEGVLGCCDIFPSRIGVVCRSFIWTTSTSLKGATPTRLSAQGTYPLHTSTWISSQATVKRLFQTWGLLLQVPGKHHQNKVDVHLKAIFVYNRRKRTMIRPWKETLETASKNMLEVGQFFGYR